MLYQHQSDFVIGRWASLKEDDHRFAVGVGPANSIADDIYAPLKAGYADGLSIGYNIRSDGVAMCEEGITDIDMREASVVGDPGDEPARSDPADAPAGDGDRSKAGEPVHRRTAMSRSS
jgi:HK97 family phage prohead protease